MVAFSLQFNLYLVEGGKIVNSLTASQMNLCISHMPSTMLHVFNVTCYGSWGNRGERNCSEET